MIADLISQAGDIIFTIALSWSILESTDSVLAASLIPFFRSLSQALISIISGLITDSFSRRKLMIFSMFCQSIILLIFLPFVQGDLQGNLLIFLPLTLVLYLFSTIGKDAQNVMIPDIVKKENLITANSIDVMLKRIVIASISALAGLLTTLLSLSTILLINSISFIIPAFLLLIFLPEVKMIEDKTEDIKSNGWLDDLKEGWYYIRNDSFTLVFMLLLVFLNFPYSAMGIFPLAYLNKVLDAKASLYGLTKSITFIATIVSMYLVGSLKIFNQKPIKFFTIGVVGAGAVLLFLTPVFPNSVILTLAIFFSFHFLDSLSQPVFVIFRGRIPTQIRGRVFGLFNACVLIITPLFTLVSGYMMDRIDLGIMALIISFSFMVIGMFSRKMEIEKNEITSHNI